MLRVLLLARKLLSKEAQPQVWISIKLDREIPVIGDSLKGKLLPTVTVKKRFALLHFECEQPAIVSGEEIPVRIRVPRSVFEKHRGRIEVGETAVFSAEVMALNHRRNAKITISSAFAGVAEAA